MSDDTLHVKGGRALAQFLDQLAPKIQRNVMRGALRAGANVIAPAVRSGIRPQDGVLAASVKVRTGGRGAEVTARVYTRVFYARFVEYGTKPHTITAKNRGGLSVGGLILRSVEHPGAQPRPYFRPAFDGQAVGATQAVAAYVKDRLATKHGIDTSGVELDEGPE